LAASGRTLRQALQVGLLALGAALVVGMDASPGIMVAATLLLGRALQPLEQLGTAWRQYAQAQAAWERLAKAAAPSSGTKLTALPAPRGQLDLQRVVFSPESAPGAARRAPLLRGVDLAVAPGEHLGVLGSSGSGKSTLARLVLGLRTPQSGQVRLDGAP